MGAMFVFVLGYKRGGGRWVSKSACFGLGANQDILRLTSFVSITSGKHGHLLEAPDASLWVTQRVSLPVPHSQIPQFLRKNRNTEAIQLRVHFTKS